ncbi:MAG: 30S ribosomal protein S9 [Candidatus Saganbacteria bacterium]|nr:30S ribosomal protein S9 [Candidatus Saganbacteria bacterium]
MEATIEKKKTKTKSKVNKYKKKENVFYGTGRRKTATAKVWLTPGSGKRTVNGKDAKVYFCKRAVLLAGFEVPFNTVDAPPLDLRAEVFGGGVPAQSDAIRMGVARALVEFDSKYRKLLRSKDLLMRDPREKERKKAGLKRARKAFQYTKR